MPRPSRARLLVVMVVVLTGAVAAWVFLVDRGRSHVVGDADRPGWHTVELDGVRVDVPASWERASRRGCEFQFERWAPRSDRGCRGTVGVSFYASATFDAAQGPGVHRRSPGWGGYALAGDLAVDVAAPDREVVSRVLASVRRAG